MAIDQETINFVTIQQATGVYDFNPQADISPLESAWISHFFAMFSTGDLLRPVNHPKWELIKRHFEEEEN